jgi:phospho-N-acetylmuramoyl-pentapeptide-transferase
LTGARFINLLKRHSLVQEKKREDIPERHAKKEGTPTMGGILITLSILITILLWGNLRNEYVLFSTLIILLFAGIGLLDDLSKKRRTLGIKGKIKFLLECMVVLICFLYIYYKTDFSTVLNIPFFKKLGTEIGILYFLFAILVIVGSEPHRWARWSCNRFCNHHCRSPSDSILCDRKCKIRQLSFTTLC